MHLPGIELLIGSNETEQGNLAQKLLLLPSALLLNAFMVGLNLLAILTQLKLRSVRISVLGDIFLTSLVTCDLLIATLVLLPFILAKLYFGGRWPFGPSSRHVWQVADAVLSSVGLYNVLLIVLDRWWNLEKPLRVLRRKAALNRRLLLLVWLLPTVVWPLVYVYAEGWLEDALVLLFVYCPSLVLLFVSARIAVVVRGHLHFVTQHATYGTATVSTQQQQQQQQHYKSAPKLSVTVDRPSLRAVDFDSVVQEHSDDSRKKKVLLASPLHQLERSSARQVEEKRPQQHHLNEAFRPRVKSTPTSVMVMPYRSKRSAEAKFNSVLRDPSVTLRRKRFPTTLTDIEYSIVSDAAVALNDSTVAKLQGRKGGGRAKRVKSGRSSSKTPLHQQAAEGAGQLLGRVQSVLSSKKMAAETGRRRLFKSVWLVTSCFCLCWMPLLAGWPLCRLGLFECPPSWREALLMVNYLGPLLHPFVYTFNSPRSRMVLKTVLDGSADQATRRKLSAMRSVTML